MRGRRFYGGGSGFLLCFAAERKRCATGSLFQLPLPSHKLLREKDTVQHNRNRAVTAFLFPTRFCGKRWLCARIFCTIRHCALRCFPPEAQCRAPGSSRQFSLQSHTLFRKERPSKVGSHLKSAAFLCALSGKPPPARDRVTA